VGLRSHKAARQPTSQPCPTQPPQPPPTQPPPKLSAPVVSKPSTKSIPISDSMRSSEMSGCSLSTRHTWWGWGVGWGGAGDEWQGGCEWSCRRGVRVGGKGVRGGWKACGVARLGGWLGAGAHSHVHSQHPQTPPPLTQTHLCPYIHVVSGWLPIFADLVE